MLVIQHAFLLLGVLMVGIAAAGPVCSTAENPPQAVAPARSDEEALRAMRDAACASPAVARLAERAGTPSCVENAPRTRPHRLAAAPAPVRALAIPATSPGDGLFVARQRVLTLGSVALDLVSYLSSGLLVGGLFCYVDDGQPRSTLLHLHGGLGGIFVNPDGGDIVGTCYSWAAHHGRNAFVPSFRGQDGGQGQPELCLGEADDVAAAAILLRGFGEVDPDRMALIGGSMGGCVALKAGALIPDLRAVLSIAPPTDWAAMVSFHRTQYVPATETRCDGSTVSWNEGGPAFADTLDQVICGHIGCPIDAYNVRSPIPLVYQSTNPTLVVSASADNVVPVFQQVLWSALRHGATGEVAVDVRDRCSPPAAPALVQDALIFVLGAYHLMEDGPLVSGLQWVLEQLDATLPPSSAGS